MARVVTVHRDLILIPHTPLAQTLLEVRGHAAPVARRCVHRRRRTRAWRPRLVAGDRHRRVAPVDAARGRRAGGAR